jgi:ABC-type branched-subunit amino acid transport system substrate-binding protein
MTHRRTLAVLLAFTLVALTAACGSRLSEDERALALSTSGDGGTGGLSVGGGTDGEVATDVEVGGADGTDGAAAPEGGATGGGDGGATGGGGEGGDTGGAPGGEGAAACTPGSATGPGVSPTEIKAGNVSQLSGLVPKFGQTGVNGVKAYFNMVNNQGGVCGRKLTLVVADDRFQSAQNRAETEKIVPGVIALVGNVSVVDDGGAPIIDAKGIADISLATTQPRIEAKNNFPPNPIDPTPGSGNGLVKILEYFKRTDGISKPAIFYQDVATGVNQSNNYKIDFQKAGIPVVATYPVAPTATNFRSQANDMKEKEIDFVITVAEVNAMANLARAFGEVDYFPKVPFYGAQVYGQKFLQLAGPNAEGTRVGLIFAIPEEAASVPGMAAFSTWYGRTAPGADPDFFAILGWVAADMFVTALRQAGPDPTQAKILEQMRTFTEYTGGGLVAPINPAQKKLTTCYHIIAVKGGKWTKEFPGQGFQC